MERVTVIIPTFNRAASIHLAIDCVMGQEYGNLELIVIDDGSMDDTRNVVLRYGERVRYLYQDNAGPAAARNAGIRSATGDLVAFLDSDDAWLPGKLEKQVAAFRANPQLGIVATNVIYRYSQGDVRSDYADSDTLSVRDKLLDNIPMVTSSVMVKAACIADVGGFDESLMYAEDWEFFYRVARSYDAEILPDHLVIFNRADQGANLMADTVKRERLVRDTLICLEKIYGYPENCLRQARKRRNYHAFLRWIALRDTSDNPVFARKYLVKVLLHKPWDLPLYGAIAKNLFIGTPLYALLKNARASCGKGGH